MTNVFRIEFPSCFRCITLSDCLWPGYPFLCRFTTLMQTHTLWSSLLGCLLKATAAAPERRLF